VEAEVNKSIPRSYKATSGQMVNLDRSNVMFRKGIALDKKKEVLLTLDIRGPLLRQISQPTN